MSKIFGVGLSRTGTTSLGLGLEQLGLNVIHFPIDIFSKNDLNVYNIYDAFVDLPIPLYYQQLDKKFPGSKFILTTRDENKWLASMEWLFTKGRIIWRQGEVHDRLHQEIYHTTTYSKEILLQQYRSYNQAVINYFANRPQDFIHMDIDKQELNFANLCTFLNLPALTVEFPRTNEKRDVSLWNRIEYFLWYNLPLYRKFRYYFIRLIK